MDLNKIKKPLTPFRLGEVKAEPQKKVWRWKDEPKATGPGGWKTAFTCTMCSLSPAGLRQRVKGAAYFCSGSCLIRFGKAGAVPRRGFVGRTNGRTKPDWYSGSRTERYRADLGHHVRSRWEANVARWLLWKGQEYCYEPTIFQVAGEGYCPDFWVYEWGIWLEVKGLWLGRARRKVRSFVFEYTTERLAVVDQDLYRELGREYKAAYKAGEIQGLEAWEE